MHLGIAEHRADDVRPHPALAVLERDDLGQAAQRELGGGVRAGERRALHRVDRADVDDRTGTRRAQEREAGADAEERSEHVDPHHPLELGGRGRVDRGEMQDRRVVDEHVQRTFSHFDAGDQCGPAGLVRHVEVLEPGRRAQLGGRRRAAVGEHVGEHHLGPLLHEAPGDRGAGPPGRAGDERDLALQSMHAKQSATPAGGPGPTEPSGRVPPGADSPRMELHPTPESWRIALFTAIGAFGIGLAAVLAATALARTAAVVAAVVVVLAALATLVPALGTMSATVDVDARGVTVRRLGRTARYLWAEVADVHVVERAASVPDGTEYHWVVPSRGGHVVAVPCLALADGRARQLPALAAPATGPASAAAREYAAILSYFRALTTEAAPAAPTALSRAV